MNYLCVCLAPAVDAVVRLSAWPTDGCVIKNADETFAPGGKALNVARWIASRATAGAVSVRCSGLLGTDNAAPFVRELARYGIGDGFLRVPGPTRVNEMFVTPGGSFKVNRPATFGSLADVTGRTDAEAWTELAGRLGFSSLAAGDVVVLSGSLPADWPVQTYRVLVERAKAVGARTVLDASGAALVEGVKARPDVLKPNAEECAALVGFVPKTADDFRRATESLRTMCAQPIISDGGAGCWFDGAFVAAPPVEVLDTTAAGDTLLAEWCWSGDSQLAVAAGSAACTMPGGTPPAMDVVLKLKERIG